MIDPLYAETLFNSLYNKINGYSVSNSARAKHKYDTEKLLYGEVPFETCKDLLEFIKPKNDGVFFDLGSGTGRVVIANHLLFNFRKSIGVELLTGLFQKSLEVKEIFEKNIRPLIFNNIQDRNFEFVNANIFDVDLSEADLIFMNHPFKDNDGLFDSLEEKFLRELKSGTKIISTIRSLKNSKFKKIDSKSYKFSWGESTAHFAEIC